MSGVLAKASRARDPIDEPARPSRKPREQSISNADRDADVELAIDLIYGPLYHRLLARHQPLDKRFATDLVNWALRGLSPS